MGMAAAGAGSAAGFPLNRAALATRAGTSSSLVFDQDNYTTLTTTISTSSGDKSVTYHFYQAITYVANPVDEKYQCLNVSVPVEIDTVAVDATDAPILLANSVGGYMPSSVADATGIGGGGMGGCRVGDSSPVGVRGHGDRQHAPAWGRNGEQRETRPGRGLCRRRAGRPGRTLVDSSGVYYGVAPAAIVDLKAPCATCASIPAASRATPTGSSPPARSGQLVDQATSQDLSSAFVAYQASLQLKDQGRSGPITARNCGEYLMQSYLQPAATRYLSALPEADRATYLAANSFITWSADAATFTWADFLTHVGRAGRARRPLTPSTCPRRRTTCSARHHQVQHFTLYSLRRATGDSTARLERDLPETLNLMNPMYSCSRPIPAGQALVDPGGREGHRHLAHGRRQPRREAPRSR